MILTLKSKTMKKIKATSIPTTYKRQDGCYNCKHVFVQIECDESGLYFCTQDGKKRPPCGSSCMRGESFGDHYKSKPKNIKYGSMEYDRHTKSMLKFMDTWDNWSQTHAVSACGICKIHVKGDSK